MIEEVNMSKIDYDEQKVPDILSTVYEEMISDTENESEHMLWFYNQATDEQRSGFDNALIYLCGWTLGSLVTIAKNRGNYVEE